MQRTLEGGVSGDGKGRTFFADVSLALRSARLQPAFTALVAVTLGLGIGASTAIYSAVEGLLLRPPPFKDPHRLVRISAVRGNEEGPLAVPELDDIKALPPIEDAAMYTDQGMYNASGFGTPEELPATIANHNLFRVLGVEPQIGATFPATFDRTRNFGLLISHGLWVRKFGRDPNVVGRSMTLDGAPGYQIYGVMPPSFTFPSGSDLFRSSGIAAAPESYRRRDLRSMMVVARLREGVSTTQAGDAMAALGRRLEREFPATNAGLGFRVEPLAETYTGAIRPYVLLLFAAVGLVLIIACANVANLLLSRAIAREREIAVRAALGATRSRLIRQLVVESLMLSSFGALLGLAVASWGVRVLAAMVPVELPPWMTVEVDARVLAFLIAVTTCAGVLSGLVPALRIRTDDLQSSLKDGARGSSAGAGHRRWRSGLIVGEVALALVLVTSAALLLQTVIRLQRVPLGFATASTLTFRVELGWAAYGTLDKTIAFHRQVLADLKALPGVAGVTFDHNLPLSGKPRDPQAVRLYGQAPDAEAQNPFVNGHSVGPDYFDVMGVALRAGRGFTDADRAGTPAVAVVSARAAERLWPGEDPLGRRLQFSDTARRDEWLTVVGVSAPVLHHELDGDPGLDIYRPFTQVATSGPYYVIRATGDARALSRAATAIVGRVDPNQAFLDVQLFDDRVSHRMWQRRLSGALFGSFAILALGLAAVGLYGVLSELVLQQRRDIGVRMALGATRSNVLRLVLARGLRPAFTGIVIGWALSIAASQGLSSLLFGVSARDPITYAVVTLVLVGVAVLACYVPARTAMRVDPIVALRSE